MPDFFKNWSLIRFLQLGVGLLFASDFLKTGDTFAGLFGGFLLVQAIFNIGCAAGACAPTPTKKIEDIPDDFEVTMEEIGEQEKVR